MCRGDAGGSRPPPLTRRCATSPGAAAGELMAAAALGTGETVCGDSGNSAGSVDRCGAAGDRSIGGV